jgi:hydrogenase maturation protease
LIRIIGIGSPFGDDAVGLEVARILAGSQPRDCEVIASDRPGMALVDLLDGAEAVIRRQRGAFGSTARNNP